MKNCNCKNINDLILESLTEDVSKLKNDLRENPIGKVPSYSTVNRPILLNNVVINIFDTTLNKPLWGIGTLTTTIWRDANGTIV